jgi:hypothetical protein
MARAPIECQRVIAQVAANYHFREPPKAFVTLQELINDALRLLWDFISNLFHLTPSPSDNRVMADWIKQAWYCVGILCVIALIYVITLRLIKMFERARAASASVNSVSKIMNSADWRSEAERLGSREDWRFACRALYMSGLRLLDESRILVYSPSRTNYECWRALAKHNNLQANFGCMTEITDRIWFGNSIASRSDFEQCLKCLQNIVDENALTGDSVHE